MPSYQNKFQVGDSFIYEKQYLTVLDIQKEDGEVEYKLAKDGKIGWHSAPLIDREASSHSSQEAQNND